MYDSYYFLQIIQGILFLVMQWAGTRHNFKMLNWNSNETYDVFPLVLPTNRFEHSVIGNSSYIFLKTVLKSLKDIHAYNKKKFGVRRFSESFLES